MSTFGLFGVFFCFLSALPHIVDSIFGRIVAFLHMTSKEEEKRKYVDDGIVFAKLSMQGTITAFSSSD